MYPTNCAVTETRGITKDKNRIASELHLVVRSHRQRQWIRSTEPRQIVGEGTTVLQMGSKTPPINPRTLLRRPRLPVRPTTFRQRQPYLVLFSMTGQHLR